MTKRLLPGGLRAQLAIAIAVVTALGVVGSFLAVYSATSSRLRAQIDAQLRTQVSEWQQAVAHVDVSNPVTLERAARRFIADQHYHSESLLIVLDVAGGSVLA